ncbi:hypothetical protein [Leptolyngbya ohadii]|uniref:hypothetical protein n=1 Tax=Leptolyngbya ohadii TaxID=1962290 RepID=UPI00117AD29A|nr:hypothetical protein [Leptolyngbya ohadii]
MQVLLDNLANRIQSKSLHPNIVEDTYLLLREIRRNPDKLSLVCHPLGFLLIKLGNLDSSSSLRLHTWLPNRRTTQNPEWLIHNHTFTLDSHILIGQVTNNVFHIDFCSHHPTGCLYSVEYSGEKSILRRTSHVLACTQLSRITYTQGSHYKVEKGSFHSTQVPFDGLAMSIVLSSEQESTSPYVIGELGAEENYVYHRVIAAPETVDAIFSILDSCLLASINTF